MPRTLCLCIYAREVKVDRNRKNFVSLFLQRKKSKVLFFLTSIGLCLCVYGFSDILIAC